MNYTINDPNRDFHSFSNSEQFNGRNVFVAGTPETPKPSYVLVHEIAHALGLEHSFPEPGIEQEYAFEKNETDNLLDYYINGSGTTKLAFWKWQIEKMKIKNQDFKK